MKKKKLSTKTSLGTNCEEYVNLYNLPFIFGKARMDM